MCGHAAHRQGRHGQGHRDQLARFTFVPLLVQVPWHQLHRDGDASHVRGQADCCNGAHGAREGLRRLKGADPSLGVEMASTGEVACFGPDKYDAFLKSIMSTGMKLPRQNILVSIQERERNEKTLPTLQKLAALGYTLYGTEKTADYLNEQGVPMKKLDYADGPGGPEAENCIDAYISRD